MGLPDEYVVLKLAERFHCLPQQIRDMPEADFRLCLEVFSAEARANELKSNQRGHYGR